MTASTGWSLQRGVYQALANSFELGTLLGGTRIYDDPPQAASYPFITLGQSLVRDWSTGTEDGAEHLLTLHVWSRAGGKKQVHDIIEAIKSTLHDQPLTLVDHDLVNLRHEFSEARPDPDGDTYHGIVRYRAVTEPSQAASLVSTLKAKAVSRPSRPQVRCASACDIGGSPKRKRGDARPNATLDDTYGPFRATHPP